MHRRCRGSRISRAPFAPLGSGAHSAPALVGRLLANAKRVRLCLRLCGCRRPAAKPQRPHNKFLLQKRNKEKELVRPLSRLQQKKINAGREAKPLAFNT